MQSPRSWPISTDSQAFTMGQTAMPYSRWLYTIYPTTAGCLVGLVIFLPAAAQTVQLPTQSVFGVQTTVSVPDRGRAFLGGVDSSTSHSVRRGVPVFGRVPGAGSLFSRRGWSHSTTASRAYATAQIIDHRELDRAVLSAARSRGRDGPVGNDAGRAAGDLHLDRRAAFLSANIARTNTRRAVTSHELARAATAPPTHSQTATSVLQTRRRQAEGFLKEGRAAVARGRTGAAKVYFQMALRRSDGQLAEAARDALARLKTETGTQLAQQAD